MDYGMEILLHESFHIIIVLILIINLQIMKLFDFQILISKWSRSKDLYLLINYFSTDNRIGLWIVGYKSTLKICIDYDSSRAESGRAAAFN